MDVLGLCLGLALSPIGAAALVVVARARRFHIEFYASQTRDLVRQAEMLILHTASGSTENQEQPAEPMVYALEAVYWELANLGARREAAVAATARQDLLATVHPAYRWRT
jgi:hypothetical protein